MENKRKTRAQKGERWCPSRQGKAWTRNNTHRSRKEAIESEAGEWTASGEWFVETSRRSIEELGSPRGVEASVDGDEDEYESRHDTIQKESGKRRNIGETRSWLETKNNSRRPPRKGPPRQNKVGPPVRS